MAPLDRALALEEVDDVAVGVGEDLHFDVARPLDEPLDVQRAVAERRGGLAPRGLHRVGDLVARAHRAACPCRRRRPTP